jgi:flagellum-specific ATP synthase
MWAKALKQVKNDISSLSSSLFIGQVATIKGLIVELVGITRKLSLGDQCKIIARDGSEYRCEVIGFRDDYAVAMSYKRLEKVGAGSEVVYVGQQNVVHPDESWRGRVMNSFAEPLDGKDPLTEGGETYSFQADPPLAHERRLLEERLDVGVRAMNTFLTCCRGQRLGIFSGSGVGKTTLMGMLTRNTAADIIVIGLIGERGRELQEFLQKDLGPEGLENAVVIVATSDESPLMRRQAAYLTLAVAEFYRDQGLEVLCLMDSVTRFAMAQREIGLSMGEPPASKGYTPSVFTELSKLLERAGPGRAGQGNITGLFTVLVEGDDHNEPIADAVRGILDGHIVLDRAIAERGRFPSIDALKSISRVMPDCNSDEETALIKEAKKYMSLYENMRELIRIGAYRKGADKEVDRAILLNDQIEKFLSQTKQECCSIEQGFVLLKNIIYGETNEGS